VNRNLILRTCSLILLTSLANGGAGAEEPIRIGQPNAADLYSMPPIYRDQAIKELGSDSLVDIEDLVPRPEIPPGHKSGRVLKKLPHSFKAPVMIFRSKYIGKGVEHSETRARTEVSQIVINSYLADRPPSGVGVIDEIESSEKVASLGQNVVVHLRRAANRGEKLSAIYIKDKIDDPIRGSVGPIVENGGTVEIGDTIDEGKHVYRAMVTSSVNSVRINSIITETPLQRTDFKRTGTQVTVSSRVIGGEFDEQRKQVGEGAVVYLDAGLNKGWKIGDIVPIQSKRGDHREDTKYPNWLRTIGLLKIVDVESTVATAIVLENSEEILIGDMTGGEPPAPQAVLHSDADDSPLPNATAPVESF
jgi:hypothetical protein